MMIKVVFHAVKAICPVRSKPTINFVNMRGEVNANVNLPAVIAAL
jgi:hypothetical protein